MTESTIINSQCIKRKESLAENISTNNSGSKKRKLNKAVAVPPAPIACETTPNSCAESIFEKNGVDVRHESLVEKIAFGKPTSAMIDSYTCEKLRLVRQNDLAGLRELHNKGESLDCCNRFGESLLGLALRRGCIDIVTFLVTEAKVNLLVRDDYGRTALHDAMWTPEPQLAQVELLLQHTPEFLCLKDVRGHTPLNYTRKEHWGVWTTFLQQREALLVARLTATISP
jgi:hypothetical protein